MHKVKKSTGLLMSVAVLLPVILYVVYFWRSGVFASIDQMSSVFAPGAFSQDRELLSPIVDVPDRTVNGVTYSYDSSTSTWRFSGVCTGTRTISLGRVSTNVSPGYLFLNFDYSPTLTGSFYTSFEALPSDGVTYYSYYPTQGSVTYYQTSDVITLLFNFQMFEGFDYTGTYLRVASSFVVAEDDFSDFRVVDHTPGSFGEFLCNNFSVHELNCVISEPVITAIGSISGEISPGSAYNVYVISAYCVYIILIWVVLLIVKIITFVPCVITKFIDKLGGAS